LASKLGDRIRELRLEHPIYKSLRHFADQLGKSPSWVSKVERNLEKPGRETLLEIARMLNVPADELFQLADQLAPDVEESLISRSMEVSGLLRTLKFLTPQQIKELEKKAEEMQKKGPGSNICDDDLLMADAAVFVASQLQVPWLDDRDIEAAACALRAAYASSQKADGIEVVWPPVDPELLVFDFLDPVHRVSLDAEACLGCDDNGYPIAGLMRVADDMEDGGEIRIDGSVAKTPLYSFTLAHEIGHWILHRQHILRARQQRSLFDERPVETQTLHRNLEGSRGKLPPEEWQANRFAAHLLMPADLVRAEFLSRYGAPLDYRAQCESDAAFRGLYTEKRHYSRRIAGEQYFKGGEVVRPLHEIFNVSCLAMSIRLEELGLVVDGESRSQHNRLAL
jgi:transcriptional regulator with XRE-family HTH domain